MIFLGFFLVFLLGLLTIVSLGRSYSLFEKIVLGMVLSFCLLSSIMFFLGLLGISLTLANVLATILLIDLLLLFFLHHRKVGLDNFFEKADLKIKKFNPLEIILLLIIGFFFITSLILNFYWPVFEWDALALYDFRALRFFETHSLAQSILTSQLTSYNYSYPFFTSLIHDFIYLLGGKNPQFLYSIFYFLFVAVFYIFLRKKISRQATLFFTLCLSALNIFFLNSLIAYANIAYVLYFVLATFLLWEFITNKKRVDYLFLSSVFLGFSTLIRTTEPFWGINIFLLIIICFKRKMIKWLFINLLIFVFLRESWALYRLYLLYYVSKIPYEPLRYYLALQNIPLIIDFLSQKVFVGRKYLIFLFFLTFLYDFYRKRVNWPILLSLFGYFILIFFGVYVFSINFSWWIEIPDSARRTSMALTPLLLYYIGLNFSKKT